MSPPRRLRQLLPDSDTIPSAALGASRWVATTTDNVPRAGTVVGELDRGDAGIGAQQRDVGGVVAADDRGRSRAAVGKDDLDFALVGQRLVGGDDQAGLPDEAG